MTPPPVRVCPMHDEAIGGRVGWKTFSVIMTIAILVAGACSTLGIKALLAATRNDARIEAQDSQLDRIERKLDALGDCMAK